MNLNITPFILVLLAVFNNVHFVFSFLPSSESTDGRSDFTHGSITEEGIYNALAEVIIEKVKPETYYSNSHTEKVKAFFNLGKKYFNKWLYMVYVNNDIYR